MIRDLARGAFLVAAFAVLLWLLRPPPPDPVVTVVRHVEPQVVYRDRPVSRTRWRDRIVYRSLPPDTVLLSQPGTVDTLVERFCDEARPAQLVLTAGRADPASLQLFGFTSSGVAYRGRWPARAPYEWTTVGDSVQLSERRRLQLPSWAWPAIGLVAGATVGVVVAR